jgi:hypothetical protein
MNWADLQGWTPLRLFWSEDRPQVEWVWAGDRLPGSDFYDHWLSGLLQRPFNLLFRRRLALEDLLDAADSLPPSLPLSGVILHMSRCGSTLAARQLAALPQQRVLSEPYILQKVILNLYPDPQVSDDLRVDWLRLLVRLLGLSCQKQEERLFIKLDALAGLRLDLLLRAFPEVPWVFLYRDPGEVLVSQIRETAGGMVPGYLDPALLASDVYSLLNQTLPDYIALVLGQVCRCALANLPQRGLAINYMRLPQAGWEELPKHFGLSLSLDQLAALQEVSRYHAKSPAQQIFQPDAQEKQAALTPDLRQAVQKWLAPVIAELESAAISQSAAANCPTAKPDQYAGV